jgi:hypothetical protein
VKPHFDLFIPALTVRVVLVFDHIEGFPDGAGAVRVGVSKASVSSRSILSLSSAAADLCFSSLVSEVF